MKRLVLFDIDGTLISGGKLFRECFEGAYQSLYPNGALGHVSFSGKTDAQICYELLGHQPPAVTGVYSHQDFIHRIIAEYLDRVERHLPHRAHEVQSLPGTHEILRALSEERGVQLGLLTGNVRRGAELKLRAARMDGHFSFGAFGDDHWNRYALPGIAVHRAKEVFGLDYVGKEVVVIGDTIHDVSCGKSIGVRSIAVGTNPGVKRDELLAASPDYFFEDLTDLDGVLLAISEE